MTTTDQTAAAVDEPAAAPAGKKAKAPRKMARQPKAKPEPKVAKAKPEPKVIEAPANDECPGCGVHLSNGISDFEGLKDLHGQKAYEMQKHEFACMACDYEWGAPTGKRQYTTGEVKNRSALKSPVQVVRDLVAANPELEGKALVAMAVEQGVSLNTARTQVSMTRKKLGLIAG